MSRLDHVVTGTPVALMFLTEIARRRLVAVAVVTELTTRYMNVAEDERFLALRRTATRRASVWTSSTFDRGRDAIDFMTHECRNIVGFSMFLLLGRSGPCVLVHVR
jgi:hypothetical protein